MPGNLFDRNKGRIFTALLIFCLTTSSYAASGSSSPQIPDLATYNVATIGQPSRMDPARAYDTASGELIQNVAQTLIWWNDKHVINFTTGVVHNLAVSEYADLNSYASVLATGFPTIVVNASGEYYTFTINANAKFQPWKAANGSVIPSRSLKASDVIYSFQRQMVYDSPYAPTWMWFGSAFSGPTSVGFSAAIGGPFPVYTNGTFVNPADETAAAALIQGWCYPGPGANDVSFHFQNPWAQGMLNQIFAQTSGCIVEPEWCQERGGWNGQFAAGWTNLWHWKPTVTRSEIDAWKDPAIYGSVAGSKYTNTDPVAIKTIMGTGPYMFTSWDQVNGIWRIDAWNSTNALDGSSYWANPTWSGNHVLTVIEKRVVSWSTRKMSLLEGEFDAVAVPRTSIYDLLAPGTNLVDNIPALEHDMLFFCTNVTGASFYQSYVGYPTHQTAAVSEFFANEHIRRAFAWAINYTQYIQEAYLGQGLQQASWWLDGLSPQSFKNTALTLRNLDYSQMQDELNQAIVEGFNVSQTGFETTLLYNFGNDQRMIAEQLIANAFQTLNSKYKVNVIPLDWPVYSDYSFSRQMPSYCWDWLADFADPHDLAQPYMQSTGYFLILQGPPFPADQSIIDAEIVAGLIETNVTHRGELYRDLQARFYNDAMTLPLVQPIDRRWARDWVQGWYFNAMYPGLYAYDLYKSTSVLENVDIKISVTPLTPTYNPVYIFHNQMRIGNGNPAPARMTWTVQVTRNDDNNAVPVLYILVGLTRTMGDQRQFVDYAFISLEASGVTDIQVTWWEDGINQVMIGSRSGIPYEIMVEALPLNGNQNDTSAENSRQALGTIIAKTLSGDVKGDGIVDIFDAILLASIFGTSPSSSKWNAYADLNDDGFIDIWDAIILTGDFQNHVP